MPIVINFFLQFPSLLHPAILSKFAITTKEIIREIAFHKSILTLLSPCVSCVGLSFAELILRSPFQPAVGSLKLLILNFLIFILLLTLYKLIIPGLGIVLCRHNWQLNIGVVISKRSACNQTNRYYRSANALSSFFHKRSFLSSNRNRCLPSKTLLGWNLLHVHHSERFWLK